MDNSELRKKRIRVILVLLAIVIFSVSSMYFYYMNGFNIDSNAENIERQLDTFGPLAPLIFVVLFVVQVIIAFIPGEPLEIAAGYVFGNFWGTIIVLIGVTIGSAIVYLLTKRFGIKYVELFISRERINSMKFLKDEKKLRRLLFTVFLIPGTPKDILTYLVGLTNIDLRSWLVIATIARLPSVITSVVVGGALGSDNHELALIVFLVTGGFSALGLYAYNKFTDRSKQVD